MLFLFLYSSNDDSDISVFRSIKRLCCCCFDTKHEDQIKSPQVMFEHATGGKVSNISRVGLRNIAHVKSSKACYVKHTVHSEGITCDILYCENLQNTHDGQRTSNDFVTHKRQADTQPIKKFNMLKHNTK